MLALLSVGVVATEVFDLEKYSVKKDIFYCLNEFEKFRDIRAVQCFDELIKEESNNECYKKIRKAFIDELGYKET